MALLGVPSLSFGCMALWITTGSVVPERQRTQFSELLLQKLTVAKDLRYDTTVCLGVMPYFRGKIGSAAQFTTPHGNFVSVTFKSA
ncbi:unnamed protein product [Calypogeia fissa]